MLKQARKPSSDPAQEKLRQDKANWNKEVSSLINDIIHLKKTMNGWPSKFYQQRTRITDPIPADPATIIGSLAGDFQELSQRASSIVQEQLNYSKNRRQKQVKQPGTPTPSAPAPSAPEAGAPPAAPSLSQQLAASADSYQLLAQGSNPVSRFFVKMLTPTRGGSEGARIRRFRMSLLGASAKTYKSLAKLQAAIVGSSKESSTVAHKQMQQTWNDWSLVTRGFSIYKSTMPAQALDQGGDVPAPSLDLPEEKQNELDKLETGTEKTPSSPQPFNIPEMMALAKAAILDYKRALTRKVLWDSSSDSSPTLSKINELIGRFTTLPANLKGQWAKSVVDAYRELIVELNQKHGTSGGTLNQVADILDAKAKAAIPPGVHMPKNTSDQLEVVAQTFLKKWLGKARHQFMPKDTSSYRLEVYKLADSARGTINQIMDLLEKGMDVEALYPLITQVNKEMTSLRLLVRSIHFADKPNEVPPLTSLF